MEWNGTPAGSIGVFDSGVGGLSVWREIAERSPREDTIYVADQAHVPYGSRSLAEVQLFSEGITRFLLGRGAKVIVIACNAASAASLHELRDRYPEVPFVGMEPAVKPAIERTRSGVVGVIATQATFQGKLFASLMAAHGDKAEVITRIGRGLVQAVETGELETPGTEALVRDCLAPLIDAGMDQLVLGCTHYPFLRPLIERIVGPGVAVIDPAPAVAAQAARVISQRRMENAPDRVGRHQFYTSGDTGLFAGMLRRLVPELSRGAGVLAARWEEASLASR